MSIVLKSLAIPALILLALVGVCAAWAVVWFLLPELRPAMRDAARGLLGRLSVPHAR
jgi:hypothetical protein